MPDRERTQPQPIITIEGERIALGPMRRDLIPLFQVWINDLQVSRFLRVWPMTLDAEIAWYDEVAQSRDTVHFVIYEMPSFRPIGSANLHKIDFKNHTAEFGIMIGENDARGHGLGTEATRLMCDYGFHALGLNSIMLTTAGWNIAGQKAYERAGFSLIGRRRACRMLDGELWDDLYYDILRDEFESPVVKDLMRAGISDIN